MTSSVAKKLLATIPEKPAELTLNDRCDRCGAEAMVRITMPIPGAETYKMHTKNHGGNFKMAGAVAYDIVLCNHHTNEHELTLVASGGVFYRKNADHLVVDRAKGDSH